MCATTLACTNISNVNKSQLTPTVIQMCPEIPGSAAINYLLAKLVGWVGYEFIQFQELCPEGFEVLPQALDGSTIKEESFG